MNVHFGGICLGPFTDMDQSYTGYVKLTTLAYPVTGLLNTKSGLTIDGRYVLENCICVAEPNHNEYTLCTYTFQGMPKMTESEIREAIRRNGRQGLKPEKEWLEELHNLGADILKWKESKRGPRLEDAWVNDMIVFTRPVESKAPINIYVNYGEDYLCMVRDEWEAIKVADRLRSFCTPFIEGGHQGIMQAGEYILSVDYDGSKYWITRYAAFSRLEFNPGQYGLIPL